MDNQNLEFQIKEINDKLDFITAHIREQQRWQREFQELKDDLTLIGKDIFQAATEELEEVAHHFDTTDLLHLGKKLLRNTRNLNKMLDQAESAADFLKDATPLGKQIVAQLMETLAELERKGYFNFAQEFFKILDTIVTSFTIEDIRLLRENIVSILITIKGITQPEILNTVNNALGFFQKLDVEVEQEISYWQLFKELRDPEMRRGIYFMIQFMKSIVQPTTNGLENQQKLLLFKKEK